MSPPLYGEHTLLHRNVLWRWTIVGHYHHLRVTAIRKTTLIHTHLFGFGFQSVRPETKISEWDTELPGNGRQVLIRHYDAEPEDHTGVIFGLLIHRKDVSSADEEEIHDEQDDFITAAIETCSRCAESGWSCS